MLVKWDMDGILQSNTKGTGALTKNTMLRIYYILPVLVKMVYSEYSIQTTFSQAACIRMYQNPGWTDLA